MRDVQHRNARFLQRTDDAEQDVDLMIVERRGRLIHDDQLGVQRDRACDGDELLDRGGTGTQGRLDVDVDPEAGQDGPRAPVCLTPLDQPAPAPRLVAHHHVLRDAAQRDQIQFLVDGRNAAVLGLARAGDSRGPAIEADVPVVAPIDTGQNFDQRRFAGAVLSDQGVHFPRRDLEACGRERDHPRERLVHARYRQ